MVGSQDPGKLWEYHFLIEQQPTLFVWLLKLNGFIGIRVVADFLASSFSRLVYFAVPGTAAPVEIRVRGWNREGKNRGK